ncbi:MAG: hypothetical protein ABR580_11680, partial [Halomonas sp.]
KRSGPATPSGTPSGMESEAGAAGASPPGSSDAGGPAQINSSQNKPVTNKPRPAAEKRFVTMEEKLAALVAKHRQP